MIDPRADASLIQIDQAANAAAEAFESFSAQPPETIARLLEKIADGIEALGDVLLQTAANESALGIDRLTGERARTTNQLRMFAGIVRRGLWKDVRIDPAIPDRKPLRRADLRRVLIPVGPVAVWAASNFPLAFSVAGGDTASALAAGCPVVLKASPAHPNTSELVAKVVRDAVSDLELHAGVFSILYGTSPEVSLALIRHPAIAAGAFTGSLRAGRALFDAAVTRATPIPFFAEMGSVNPIFVLPHALDERAEAIADGLSQSVNASVGQMCTCPGLVIGLDSPAFDRMAVQLRSRFQTGPVGTMLTPQIARSYRDAVSRIEATEGLHATRPVINAQLADAQATPALFETDARTFLENEELSEEVFGPSTIVVRCSTDGELRNIAAHVQGSLTASIHGTHEDLAEYRDLLAVLMRKAGRLIYNGYPTGVEVCDAMQHGGPYPATTDARYTSVGTASIERFGRPVCFQDFPVEFLPEALQLRDRT